MMRHHSVPGIGQVCVLCGLTVFECVLAAVGCSPEVLQVAGLKVLSQQHGTRHWLLRLMDAWMDGFVTVT